MLGSCGGHHRMTQYAARPPSAICHQGDKAFYIKRPPEGGPTDLRYLWECWWAVSVCWWALALCC
jgi:hypothetical protein